MSQAKKEQNIIVIEKFIELAALLQMHHKHTEGITDVVKLLERSIDIIKRKKRATTTQARVVYQNILTVALINDIRFTAEEDAILQELYEVSISGEIWTGLNELNAINNYPWPH
ncbi:MAG: hypothetical protein LBT80_08720 [Lactobacillaceae bacterium]|jgi:hypothetical protein|nr:hypothetical protein [Lactobacillaceae bacterium]